MLIDVGLGKPYPKGRINQYRNANPIIASNLRYDIVMKTANSRQ